MRNKKEGSNKWLLRSIAFLVLIIVVFFGYALSRELKQKAEINQQLQALASQADQIKKENMQLQERIAYLNSQDYQKLQAKANLDLQGPGEKVVVITPSPTQAQGPSGNVASTPTPPTTNPSLPNWKKWLNYFFGK